MKDLHRSHENRGLVLSRLFGFIEYLGESGRAWTIHELAGQFGFNIRTMRRWLYAAEEHALVERIHSGPDLMAARRRCSGNESTVWRSRFKILRQSDVH